MYIKYFFKYDRFIWRDFNIFCDYISLNFYLIIIFAMESSPVQKQMFSTNCKERIFNVRKVPYKPYANQKYSKFKISPFQEEIHEPNTLPAKKKEPLGMNYSSNAQKDLRRKYQILKEQCQAEKLDRLQKLKQREDQLANCNNQQDRLLREKQKLQARRDAIKQKIEQLHQRNELLRQEEQQRNEEIRIINMEYLRNMIIEMRFQNGIDIDPDQMTYQELLELQEKMGKVSKGLTQKQFEGLNRKKAKGVEDVCSICYCNVKEGEDLILLQCSHHFHVECISQWFSKEKVCPMCKQEVICEQDKSLESTQ